MSTQYFNGFAVVRVDSSGLTVPVTLDTLDVVELPGMTPLGTVDVDAFGNVVGQSLTVSTAGVTIEFSHSGDPNTFKRVTAASIEAAAALPQNLPSTFIVENLGPAAVHPMFMDLWLHDNDNADVADVNLGLAPVDATTQFALAGIRDRSYTLYGNPVTANGGRKYLNYEDGPSVQLTIAFLLDDDDGSILLGDTVFDTLTE